MRSSRSTAHAHASTCALCRSGFAMPQPLSRRNRAARRRSIIADLVVVDGGGNLRPLAVPGAMDSVDDGSLAARLHVVAMAGAGRACSPSLGVADAEDDWLASAAAEYEPVILDRYPAADDPSFPVPEGLLHFALPSGLEHASKSAAPVFHGFVLTDARGVRFYGHCLTFMERLPPVAARAGSQLRSAPGASEHHVSKCICLVTSLPFYGALCTYLHGLYTTLTHDSPSRIPLERYIVNLFEAPTPPPGSVSVQLDIGAVRVHFARPSHRDLPMMDFNGTTLLRLLDIGNVVDLLELLLAESKVILQSSHVGTGAPPMAMHRRRGNAG